jgi:molybdopterin converting factor small subunit
MTIIRVVLPAHLRALARVDNEVTLEVAGRPTLGSVLDALEARYPVLQGTIRDHVTHKRRPFMRFFACEQDLSHDQPDAPLPEPVVTGAEPFLVVGAIAGG